MLEKQQSRSQWHEENNAADSLRRFYAQEADLFAQKKKILRF